LVKNDYENLAVNVLLDSKDNLDLDVPEIKPIKALKIDGAITYLTDANFATDLCGFTIHVSENRIYQLDQELDGILA